MDRPPNSGAFIPYTFRYLYHSMGSGNNYLIKLKFSLLMPEKRVCTLE